ncbi:MAG: serine hydrolase domain-containing protein [Sphingosinicella sp.]
MTVPIKGLAALLIALAACSGTTEPVAPAREVVPPALRSIVDADVAAGFTGVVLVARGDTPILFEAHGEAGDAPIDRDRPFWISSIGKQFVAAALLKLADDGRLNLDDPLGRFFPQAPADKSAITIRQLLAYNSGIGPSYVAENQPDRESALRAILTEPLAGAPGSGFRYANSNFQLGAAIVEIVSGLDYLSFARRHLWEPAAMTATGLAGDAGASSVHANAGELPPRLSRRYWGEQGAYASAADLFRWYRALQSGRILRPETVRLMFTPVTRTGEGYAALGWFTGTSPAGNPTIYMRGNDDFGANSLIYAYPQSDIVIVAFTHGGDPAGGDLSWSRTVHRAIEQAMRL